MKNDMQIVYKNPADLVGYENNSRQHSEEQIQRIEKSIAEFGFINPVIIHEGDTIVAGHARVSAALSMGLEKIPTLLATHLTEEQMRAYVIADNRLAELSTWDNGMLEFELSDLNDLDFDITLTGFDMSFLEEDIDPYADGVAGSIADDFIVAPFSILDSRKKEWIDRRKEWQALIQEKGESREGTLAKNDKSILNNINSVSVLDATLCEIIVKWFSLKDGVAFDPFAGDSVFGFVSSYLGQKFTGIELRKEQVDINQSRVDAHNLPATYINDTSENMDKYIKDESVDFLFSCPPYADLEVYSDDPKDLSNMSHDDFFTIYRNILLNAAKKLKDNRFAVIVMGDVRGKDGGYIGTVQSTIDIMKEAGLSFYNDMLLINSIGTGALRIRSQMKNRKVVKIHQNVLVF